MTEKLLLSQIQCNDRMRQDLGNLEDLKESLQEHGLLQAIGVAPLEERGKFQVIWGGRRFTAAKELGWESIECKVLLAEEDYQLREKELEENIRRKAMTWQEEVLTLHEIHKLKVRKNALIGERWGYRETGALLGVSLGNVSYSLTVAKHLRDGDTEVQSALNLSEAVRLLVRRKALELQALNNPNSSAVVTTPESVAFNPEDIEELQPTSSRVTFNLNLIAEDTEAQMDVVIGNLGMEKRGQYLTLLELHEGEAVPPGSWQFVTMASGKLDTGNPLLQTSTTFIALFDPTFKKLGGRAFYPETSSLENLHFGARATAIASWRSLFTWMGTPLRVFVASHNRLEVIATSLLMGQPTYLNDKVDIEPLRKALILNGDIILNQAPL